MKDILSTLLSFPPPEPITDEEYDKRASSLSSTIKEDFPHNFTGNSPSVEAILDALDPSVNSLSYLFALLGFYEVERIKSRENWPAVLQPGGPVWPKTLKFFETFDPVQVRYGGHQWRRLLELVVASAEAVSSPFLAIPTVRDAILRLDPDGSTFTSTHLIFTRLCLHARAYQAALPVIEKDICHFPMSSDKAVLKRWQKLPCAEHESSMTYITTSSGLTAKLTHKDHLQYFLYGGMIYLGLKKWDRALHLLELAIIAPCSASVSLIMIHAYKKWVLASLLGKGTTFTIPKSTSGHALKAYKSVAKPYDALAEVFKTGSLDRLKAEIEVGQAVWQSDNNTGLVIQVLDASRKFSVLRLERTFAALSIPEVVARARLQDKTVEETEAFVNSLISSGELKGTLLQSADPSKPTILRFTSATSDAFSEAEIRDELAAQKQRLNKLLGHIQASDHKLELGREYIDNLRRDRKRKIAAGKNGSGAATAATAGVGNGADYVFEEDMMGDVK